MIQNTWLALPAHWQSYPAETSPCGREFERVTRFPRLSTLYPGALPTLGRGDGVFSILPRPALPFSVLDFQRQRHQAQQREKQAKSLAREFCRATVEARFGPDEKKVLHVLQRVNQKGLNPEFERAVLEEVRRHGKGFASVRELIEAEFAGNPFERRFKNAAYQEALDSWALGQNTYRGTGWDYRLYGMYRSVADFVAVCRQHPAMSAGIIGAVAFLGAKYPFLGGLSGLGIMGWGTAATVSNEVQAAQHPPRMNAAKAEHYTASGENLAAVLVTALGFHGIKDGTMLGKAAIQSVQAPTGQQRNPFHRLGQKAVAAITATERKYPGVVPHDQTGAGKWVKTTLFVSGLLDNVLLPFNWAADKLGATQKTPD